MKYIPTDKLIAEIATYRQECENSYQTGEDNNYPFGQVAACEYILDIITSLQQEQPDEQPEYGYLYTEYIHGKKPRWNVGDVLAYYMCTSNEEGEDVFGKVSNVEFDNEEGWLYTFENEDVYNEQELVEEGAYKKN